MFENPVQIKELEEDLKGFILRGLKPMGPIRKELVEIPAAYFRLTMANPVGAKPPIMNLVRRNEKGDLVPAQLPLLSDLLALPPAMKTFINWWY